MKLLAVHNNKTFLNTLTDVVAGFEYPPVICESTDLEEALQIIGNDADIGLVLVSMDLANTHCSIWMTAIRSHRQDIPVVFISDTVEADVVTQVVRDNLVSCPFDSSSGRIVLGAILKGLNAYPGRQLGTDKETLRDTGSTTLSKTHTDHAPDIKQDHSPRDLIDTRLTERQREVLRLVQQGLSNKAIGKRLKLAEGTVKIHCLAIFRELGVTNRTQAALKAEKRYVAS